MPHPRPRRAPRPIETDDHAELARLHHLWWRKWLRNAWIKSCRREMWRRVVLNSPPRGPWADDPALTAAISHEYVAQGAIPPPGLPERMYPPGWTPPRRGRPQT